MQWLLMAQLILIKSAMMEQKETSAKEAINVDGNSDDVIKLASTKATTHPMPYKLSKKKQKKTPAKESVSTKQSDGAVVTSPLSKPTAKRQKKKAAEDAVIAKCKGNASIKATLCTPHSKVPKSIKIKASAKGMPKKKKKKNAADETVAANSNANAIASPYVIPLTSTKK